MIREYARILYAWLAYVYDSYTYDLHVWMIQACLINTHKLILADFALHASKRLTYVSSSYTNHTHRNRKHKQIMYLCLINKICAEFSISSNNQGF